MSFTPLHRALGRPPSPVTDELLNAAVAARVTETSDLDWKSELPPAKELHQSDFPKDVAAMANSGGGVIAYGVRESQKAATERVDAGICDETYERSLRRAAIVAIVPPVFHLTVDCLGSEGNRAVVIEVPSSVETPHLIFRNEYFGAPIRNDADTVWMKERELERLYRARFDERRHSAEALDALSVEASAGRDTTRRAWFIGVAHPRIPQIGDRPTAAQARAVLEKAKTSAFNYANRRGIHPLLSVDRNNVRPGLRRWVAPNTAYDQNSSWKEASATIHFDGSTTLVAALGGHRVGRELYFDGSQVDSVGLECGIADFMALVRATAEATGNSEYEIRVGIAWIGDQPLSIVTRDELDYPSESRSTPLHVYTPVEATINAIEPEGEYHRHVYQLAEDCVNQGGISPVFMTAPPEPAE